MARLTDAQRAALTARLRVGRPVPADELERRDPGAGSLPLSFGQEQLWFLDRFAPGQATYNIPLAISVRGTLDPAALQRALSLIAARHEALRTRLVAGSGGQPVQVIDPPAAVPIATADLSGLGAGARPDRLRELIDADAVVPFDLATGPLLRVTLIRCADHDQVLLVVVHHAIFDGWSAGVLLRELAALYRQEAGEEAAELAELPVQFADYALWERSRLAGEVPAELAGYWRQALDGFETVRFPADRPRPLVQDWAGGLAVLMTDLELLDELRELSREQGCTLFVTLMAALTALLSRYTGQSDLVVGTVSANRGRPELGQLIGFLVNTLPIRTDLSGDPRFTELVGRVKQGTTDAYAHQDLPFGKLVDVLQVARDPGRAPVFQIALTYAERDSTPIEAAGVRFALTDLVAGIHAAKFDLSFLAEARPGGLWFECSYKSALFDDETVRRLLTHLEVLLRGVIADPDARLSELPVLTAAERDAELIEWNDTAADYPELCLHHAFEQQVRRTPDAIAAEYEAEQLSYAELDARAGQIARGLRELGVGPESLVGICLPTSLARLAAFLGCWKAGGGYVPLDPGLPRDRLAYLIGDTGMSVIVTDAASAPSLPDTTARLLRLDDAEPAGDDSAAAPFDSGVTAANVAYVLYTSGSTGQPKGVVIEHRHAANLLHGLIEALAIGPHDSVLQFSPFTFDVSVLDTYLPLLAGARTVLAPTETLHTPRRLIALMRERGITFLASTPSVIALLGDADFPALRILLSGGEELPSELVIRWLRPGLTFINGYGPTEVTVVATFAELTAGSPLPPSIGLPAANYRAYVLDPRLNPVPVGVIGELHLGGASVGRGYLNRPELTAARFIDDPFRPGERLYKTGDLCHRRPDGTIVFDGRTDHQVKVRGLRIELGEIETTLASHPDLAQVMVTVTTSPAGDPELTAYLRPAPDADAPDPDALRRYLATTLPGYMVPAHLITVDGFPLNRNGKIDRAALPSPAWTASPAGEPASSQASATRAEATLIELYESVLHRPDLRPTDNFFAAGGNSLQVMRLIDLIATHTGTDLTPAAIFLYPTPRLLAAQLATGPADGPAGPLIKLSGGAAEAPLILIHAIGGTVFGYTELAAELAGRYEVYGLQAPGLTAPGGTGYRSLGELADHYLEIIRAAFPDGPYNLAGWSMGGVIAYEIARKLEYDGAKVGLLGLLDAPFALPRERALDQDLLASQFLTDAIQSLGQPSVLLPDPGTVPAAGQLDWLAAYLADGGNDGQGDAASQAATGLRAQLRDRFDVFAAHSKLIAGYQPDGEAIAAPALIVSASQSPNATTRTQWPQVLGGSVTTLPVDGDHYSFLRPPVVGQVAASLLTVP